MNIDISPTGLYTAAEVAAALQHSVRWLRANRRALARDGFPPPVSRVGRPRWLGAALLAWLHASSDAPEPAAGGNVVSLAARAHAVATRRHRESG